MRTAVVHDWLVMPGGAERVLEEILRLLPEADLYCIADFMRAEDRHFLKGRPVRTSFIQKLPFACRRYRSYLPLMPAAVAHFDLSSYDLVVSSSHAVAKGVSTSPGQFHISYVHTPARYAWDMQQQYLALSGMATGFRGIAARLMLHYFRRWDVNSARHVDRVVANSRFVAARIRKIYQRDAVVIYPPVDLERFNLRRQKEPFYLTVSRLVAYKRVDLIVEAFGRMPQKRLVVIGGGPELAKLRAIARPNVALLGYQPSEVVQDHVRRAQAFVFAAEEDFGIAPVEAQACGTPVIAYNRGGVTESVVAGETGVFFEEQTAPALMAAVEEFEKGRGRFDPARIRANAEAFGAERFRREFARLIEDEWAAFTARNRARHPQIAAGTRR
ncbi:MAG: glycosyltransferase family 4 protein [Candidatus Binataceae bacterium]